MYCNVKYVYIYIEELDLGSYCCIYSLNSKLSVPILHILEGVPIFYAYSALLMHSHTHNNFISFFYCLLRNREVIEDRFS